MTRPDDLTAFVRDALTRGVNRADIEATLLNAGWTSRQVDEALAAYADMPFPIPVPAPRTSTDAREAFVHGLFFVLAYLTCYHLGLLLFAIVDLNLVRGDRYQAVEARRWAAAVLIVTVPLLLGLGTWVAREIRQDASRRISDVRVKLAYVTLFISAAIVVGVLAGLVYSFLGDDLTARFVYKSLIAIIISVSGFVYFLEDVKAGSRTTKKAA